MSFTPQVPIVTSPPITSWYTDDGAAKWDTCKLGGQFLPGLAEVTSIAPERKIDEKKTKGVDGIKITDEGITAGRVTIKLTLYTDQQWKDWQSIRPTFDPRKTGGLRTPLDIDHPATADDGIAQVYVTKLEKTPPKGGIITITIQCVQWFAQPQPTKTKTKPKDPALELAQAVATDAIGLAEIDPSDPGAAVVSLVNVLANSFTTQGIGGG